MKRRFCSLILIMSFTVLSVCADDMNSRLRDYATKQYSIIPPAPEVASLMRYIDIPVSHFTGIPQIEIPIYTILEGTLSIPISLSYRGGGIKQNELPGIIGNGWSLNAGVTISRTVYGLPDECNRSPMRGFLNLTAKDKEMRNEIIALEQEHNPYLFNYEYFYTDEECEDYNKGYVDFANDIFKVYGMGISGSFIYNTFNDVILSTPSSIIFKPENRSYIGTLIFYDKEYNKYYFEKNGVDSTKTQISAENFLETDSLKYRSAWHVTKIESLQGDIITFEYSKPIYRNDFIGTSQFYINYNTDLYNITIDRGQISSSWHKYDERNLVAIKSKSVTARFHYDSSQRILESISIQRNDGTVLWEYKLSRNSYGNLYAITKSTSKNTQKLYEFYYEPIINSTSFSIDHWGYCNGAENTSLLPDIGYASLKYKKANREANKNYTKQGLLTRINYLMGGYTILSWEPNDYSYIKSFNNRITSKESVIENITKDLLIGKLGGKRLAVAINNLNNGDQIRLNLGKYFNTLVSGMCPFVTINFYNEYNRTYHQDPYPQVKIYKVENNGTKIVKETYYLDKSKESDSIKYCTVERGNYAVELLYPTSFEDAPEDDIEDFFGVNGMYSSSDYGYVPFQIIRKDTIMSEPQKKWGGMRIKSITSATGYGSSVTKEYLYKPSINSAYSSGIIYSEPYYQSSGYSYIQLGDTIMYKQFIGVNSDGVYYSTLGEIGIEYSHVIEKYSGAAIGEIEYTFDCMANTPDEEHCLFAEFVPRYFKTLTSNAHHRGNLREKKFTGFVGVNDNKVVYKKQNYNYNIIEKTNIPTFTGPLYTVVDVYLNGEVDSITGKRFDKNYTINKFKLIPYNKRIRSESVWEKDFYTDAESEQTVSYTYYGEEGGYSANTWNSFVRTKSYVNSQGQTVTVYYTYYKMGNIPLEQKELEITVIDDVVVSARRNVYGSNHKLSQTFTGCVGMQFSSNFNIPMGILSSATYPEISKKEYSYRYDSQGNIVEIRFNGRVLASYLWGYMGKHPIIEAVGVSYDELFDVAKDYSYYDGLYLDNMNLFIDAIRADNRLAGKEILSYTYHWLLGMATSTDSRGVTNTYLLDDFGRLSGVKDTNGYYISKYDYHYKGF